MKQWQVLIVEDDPQMREFFAASVERAPELCLVASVGTVAHALVVLDNPAVAVDVLLTDLGLPDGNGLEVIRHARLKHLECESLVISMFGDEENVLASIEAGALGYIHKDASPEDVANAILQMKAGASPISPMIARRLLARLKKPVPSDSVDKVTALMDQQNARSDAISLSPREHEVLELIARGFSYQEISRLTQVSVHTVQSHIKSLYRKLAVNSKSEAVFEATKMGLLQLHQT
jgi:DNA-binding NarL/FixJ family response regulator